MSDVTPQKTIRCDWRTPVADPAVETQCTKTVTYDNAPPWLGSSDAQREGWRFGRDKKDFCPEHAPTAQLNGLIV